MDFFNRFIKLGFASECYEPKTVGCKWQFIKTTHNR